MRSKTTAALALAGTAALLAFAPLVRAGTPDGNGAQKSGLSPNTDSDKCHPLSGASTNGWAILNKTGAPAPSVTSAFQGEVHLTGATPNTTYMIEVGTVSGSSKSCMVVGSLTTNGQGIGNGHIPDQMHAATGAPGTYFVVLLDPSSMEAFASGTVPEM